MLRSAHKLQGFAITATDGAIGEVDQLYLDDEKWTIRYLVVNTGTWRESEQVLISPRAIKRIDWDGNQIYVSLTTEQVRNSPDIDAKKLISRRYEKAYCDYYGYECYWDVPGAMAQVGLASDDVHLRSSKEVIGYHIEAKDGDLGHVHDLIVEDETWVIRYIVVKTSNWWIGKKVLISPQWIARISWEEEKVFVDLSREEIKQAPVYDESRFVTREYETSLFDHYERPRYWLG